MIEDFLSKIDSYLYEKGGGLYSFYYTVVGSTYVFAFVCEDGETSVDLMKVSKKELKKFVEENLEEKVYSLYNKLVQICNV